MLPGVRIRYMQNIWICKYFSLAATQHVAKKFLNFQLPEGTLFDHKTCTTFPFLYSIIPSINLRGEGVLMGSGHEGSTEPYPDKFKLYRLFSHPEHLYDWRAEALNSLPGTPAFYRNGSNMSAHISVLNWSTWILGPGPKFNTRGLINQSCSLFNFNSLRAQLIFCSDLQISFYVRLRLLKLRAAQAKTTSTFFIPTKAGV